MFILFGFKAAVFREGCMQTWNYTGFAGATKAWIPLRESISRSTDASWTLSWNESPREKSRGESHPSPLLFHTHSHLFYVGKPHIYPISLFTVVCNSDTWGCMAPEGGSWRNKAEETLIRIIDAYCTLFLYHSSNKLMSFCHSLSHSEFKFIGNNKLKFSAPKFWQIYVWNMYQCKVCW